jgi:exosortase E/protease (VPEID-CTERM system)
MGRTVTGAAQPPSAASIPFEPPATKDVSLGTQGILWAVSRRVCLFLTLLVELLFLMVTFDTQKLATAPTAWAQVVNWAPQYLRLAISIIVATTVFAAVRRPSTVWAFVSKPHKSGRLRGSGAAASLAVHGGGLLLFALVTNIVVSTGPTYLANPALWTMAWVVTGGVTLVAWALAAWPLASWRDALRQESGSLMLGAAVGTTVWAAGFVSEDFWLPLARFTFNTVAWTLSAFYGETVNDVARLRIGTPTFSVIISPECSGYEGVGLILAFLSVYLWLVRKDLRFPHALILLPLGAITIWLANAARIVVLIAIGTAGWQGIALGGFHSQAGWIAFNALALGFVFMTNRFGYFKTTAVAAIPARESASDDGDATLAYLGPFVVITATAMLTGAVAAGFDWLYPLRVVAAAAVLWVYRRHYADLRWSFSWWSVAIGFVTFIIWIVLTPAGTDRNAGWPAAMGSIPVHWAAAWMLFRIIGYVVTVPLAEELAFRGFLTRRLQRSDFQRLPVGSFSWPSFVMSSALFGAFHGSLWLPGTIAGMLFALALYRRGAFGEAVWAHATTNALLAIYASATGRWWLWS